MDNDSVVSNCNFCYPHILFVGCLGRLKKSDGSDQRKLSWKKDWKFYRKEGTWCKGVRRDSLRFEKVKNTKQIRTFDVLIMVNMTTANELYSECAVFFLVSSDQEQREFEAIAHVRDSVQMVENAILERDQV